MSKVYRFKTKPRKFQFLALKRMVKVERGGLWLPMRAGKSKVAIDWAGVLHLKYGVRRVLIVTHSPTTFGVWKNEIRKHCPLPHAVWVQSLDNCTSVFDAPPHQLEFLILNVHRVYDRKKTNPKNLREWEPVKSKWLRKWKPDAIIVDESTCIGDPSAVQTRHLYFLQRDCGVRFKLLLTGTPLHRNVFNTFGQFKFLEDGIFGTSLGAFKSTYGLWGGFHNNKLLKYTNLKQYRKKIEPYIYQLHRIPYRPPIHQIIPVELSEKERDAYEEMERESFLRVNGQDVAATIILTRLLKCAQLAAGHIKDSKGKWHRTGTSQMDAATALLTSLNDSDVSRVVIYARHIPELKDAAMAARKAGYKHLHLLHGGVHHEEREERIAAFHEKGGAFISQVATGSMGIDLSCADTTLWYTLTESLLQKDQADARIRIHGDKRPLTYYYLLPQDTVLETMYMALQGKMDLVELVAKHPSLIHWTEKG